MQLILPTRAHAKSNCMFCNNLGNDQGYECKEAAGDGIYNCETWGESGYWTCHGARCYS